MVGRERARCQNRKRVRPPGSVPKATIAERGASRPEGSYTAELLADPARIAAKVREEAGEVAEAAGAEADERVAEEAADLLYHLSVLLAARGLSLEDALEVLNGRRR